MNEVTVCFRVFFEEPFWVSIYERAEEKHLSVCKITFGAEPKDYEVFDYLLKQWYQLKMSPAVENEEIITKPGNPKRMRREVKYKLLNVSTGTKSQLALNLLREQNKKERRVRKRALKEEENKKQFMLKQLKKKRKRRGR